MLLKQNIQDETFSEIILFYRGRDTNKQLAETFDSVIQCLIFIQRLFYRLIIYNNYEFVGSQDINRGLVFLRQIKIPIVIPVLQRPAVSLLYSTSSPVFLDLQLCDLTEPLIVLSQSRQFHTMGQGCCYGLICASGTTPLPRPPIHLLKS